MAVILYKQHGVTGAWLQYAALGDKLTTTVDANDIHYQSLHYIASHLSHAQSNPHVFFSLNIRCPRLSFLSSPLR
jgi:hypothetical protein